MRTTNFPRILRSLFPTRCPEKAVLAVSGGVDSMLLAYLMLEFRKKHYPQLRILAVTIDHSYRPESCVEAQKVGTILEGWGIDHHIRKLKYTSDPRDITNFEEVARLLRYQELEKACDELGTLALFLGHNYDDQLETFLQRLRMNSTLFGLAGTSMVADFPVQETTWRPNPVQVYRPFLHTPKSRIRQLGESLPITWFEDVTNTDVTITTRNLDRHMILLHLDRQKLETLFAEVQSVRSSLNTRLESLGDIVKSGSYHFDRAYGTISFSLPRDVLIHGHPLLLSRWLYLQMGMISTSRHYHWGYAKIERLAMPRIVEFAEKHMQQAATLCLTYLNVKMFIEFRGDSAKFRLTRQNRIGKEMIPITLDQNQWVRYGPWWIRADKDATIEPYSLSMKKRVLKAFPDLTRLLQLQDLPVISKNGDILALPTLKLGQENLEIECELAKSCDWWRKPVGLEVPL